MMFRYLQAMLVFASAFALAVGVNAVTGNYSFDLSLNKGFTYSEAESLMGKNVTDTCITSQRENTGTIVSHSVYEPTGVRQVKIKWDKPGIGDNPYIHYEIGYFYKCIAVNE